LPEERRGRNRTTASAVRKKWDDKHPQIAKSWTYNSHNLSATYNYPLDIRKVTYTNNVIESINGVVHKATRYRKVFLNDDSTKKVVYLAIHEASKKWTMPIRNWKPAMSRFGIEFGKRVTTHL